MASIIHIFFRNHFVRTCGGLSLPILFALCLAPFVSSCSKDDDEDVYPNIITEMADAYTNEHGVIYKIVLDNDKTYNIENQLSGYHKNAIYRILCGYEQKNSNYVHLFQMTGVPVLRDSTKIARRDPVELQSVWRTGRYINLHIDAKTQGGKQYWGFITDSIVASVNAEGMPSNHAYVSLHHNQNGDPTSYTEEVYLSLPIDSIKNIEQTSPVTLHINTAKGLKTIEL